MIRIVNLIGEKKAKELLNLSKNEYMELEEIYNTVIRKLYHYDDYNYEYHELKRLICNSRVHNIYKNVSNYICKMVKYGKIEDLSIIPKTFINKNKNLFLIRDDIPEDVRNRFYKHRLDEDDLIDYRHVFLNYDIDEYIDWYRISPGLECLLIKYRWIAEDLIKKYPDYIKYLIKADLVDTLGFLCIDANKKELSEAIKHSKSVLLKEEYVLENREAFINYDYKLYKIDYKLNKLFHILNLDNIKQFISNIKDGWQSFVVIKQLLLSLKDKLFSSYNETNVVSGYYVDYESFFQNGALQYKEFEKRFVKIIQYEQNANFFYRYFHRKLYNDWLKSPIQTRHPEIFISNKAPEELQSLYIANSVTLGKLFLKEDYIPFLIDKDLSLSCNFYNGLKECIKNLYNGKSKAKIKEINYNLLSLIVKYGEYLEEIRIEDIIRLYGIKNINLINEHIIRKTGDFLIYNPNKLWYLSQIEDIRDRYQEHFLLPDELRYDYCRIIKDAFYDRDLSYGFLHSYPDLVNILENKRIDLILKKDNWGLLQWLPPIIGKKEFLKLCSIYGDYLYDASILIDNINKPIRNKKRFINHLKELIEDRVYKIIFEEEIDYDNIFPEFLRNKHPELFLSDDAPEELKNIYYNNPDDFNFRIASEYKKYLVDKPIRNLLIKKWEYEDLEEILGADEAIKLGMKYPEIIDEALEEEMVEDIHKWYIATNGRYIPDIAVMNNFKSDHIYKFLNSLKIWNNYMKDTDYSQDNNTQDGILKLMYVLGVFDHDDKGIQYANELLQGLPKTINDVVFGFDIIKIKAAMNQTVIDAPPYTIVEELIKVIKEEKVAIDTSKDIFEQVYKKNKKTCTWELLLPWQKYPKTTRLLRKIFKGDFTRGLVISGKFAHDHFGSFNLVYDPEFRDFLIENMETIMSADEGNNIGSIQKNFHAIKAYNGNRKLTWENAIHYIKTIEYSGIELCNNGLAKVSSIAGYLQGDFEKLQEIYNYGKLRTFSSIPRVDNTYKGYKYEILRLDDPLALVIGTLTDCCQELNNVAESCMIHSMTDKNGRLFVVKDEEDRLVSQSWVWRNGNVLCFDNIEIPERAIRRFEKNNDNSRDYSDEIYNVYEKAAKELIEKDNNVYGELYNQKLITEDQYKHLKLNKVTVGDGYNDIKDTIIERAKEERSNEARPLPYESAYLKEEHITKRLYTSDSEYQHIIKKTGNASNHTGSNLFVYPDEFKILTIDTMTKTEVNTLFDLEISTKENSDLIVRDEIEETFNNIAYEYYIDSHNINIIMNANFAVIYTEDEDEIDIYEILYNTRITTIHLTDKQLTNLISTQIANAINQIKGNKKVEIMIENDTSKNMYKAVVSARKSIYVEQGLNVEKTNNKKTK